MMKNNFNMIVITALTLFLSFVYGGTDKSPQTKAGIAGFTFLKIPASARIAGMGNAYIAVADNVDAIFVNPAGITEAGAHGFHLSNTKWLVNSNLYTAAITMHLGYGHYLGLSFVGLIPEQTLERSTTSPDPNGLTGRNIKMYDYALGLTYAVKMFDRLSLGIKANYVNETIMDQSVSKLLFDFGSLYDTGFKTIRIAMGLRNFGSDGQYPNKILFNMPIIFDMGVAGEIYGQDKDSKVRITLSGEGSFYIDFDQRYQIGTEIWLLNTVAFRGGYIFNAGTKDPYGRFDYKGNRYACGLGGKINAGSSKILFDISYTISDRLFDNILRFSFGGTF